MHNCLLELLGSQLLWIFLESDKCMIWTQSGRSRPHRARTICESLRLTCLTGWKIFPSRSSVLRNAVCMKANQKTHNAISEILEARYASDTINWARSCHLIRDKQIYVLRTKDVNWSAAVCFLFLISCSELRSEVLAELQMSRGIAEEPFS